MFKIISVGWNCADVFERTLRSVEEQTRDDYEICVVYDGGDGGGHQLEQWNYGHDDRWSFWENTEQLHAVRNQYEGIQSMAPADEDIIVFLDLDGDQLAHPGVLQRLFDYYADDTFLTYGSYRPVPDPGTCPPAIAFPADVITNNSYRQHLINGGSCCFNHLRTMKGKVFNAIPEDRFKWPNGEWYIAGTDYLFMISGLELAGGRHKFIEETMMLYNSANPYAEHRSHSADANACINDLLNRPALQPLP